MQFQRSTPPQNVRIRRIPTIRLQTLKHSRRNCMRNCDAGAEACCGTRGWRQSQIPRKVARNSIAQTFYNARKRCNSNDLDSLFEIIAGELRAKLLGGGGAWPGHSQRPSPTGVEGAGGTCRGAGGRWRGLAGLRGDAPSEARSADGERAGRHPPAHTAAGASGARNTRGATSNQAGNPHNTNARQPERAAARSRSQWSTQRRRAATTSATWTAFRAAPLRRLSPETTRTRPRLPSTAWS